MMLRNVLPVIFAVGLTALLAGCNPPIQLTTITIDDALTDVVNNPNYNKMDAKSFKGKIIQYPAGGGYHTVPISDYLLSRVVLAVPKNEKIKNVRLLKFNGKCEMSGVFLPRALCNGYVQIKVSTLSETKVYDSSLDNHDVGNVFSPHHFGISNPGLKEIRDQMKIFIRALTSKLRIQL